MSERPEHRPRIGEILVSKQLLSEGQRATVLRAMRDKPGVRFGTVAVDQGLLPELELLKALSEQLGVPAIDLTQLVIPIHHLKYISHEVARRHEILPIMLKDDQLVLAMADPGAERVIEQLEYITGRAVFSYVTSRSELVRSIEEVYEARRQGKAFFIGRNAPDDYLSSMGLSREGAGSASLSESGGVERITVLPDGAELQTDASGAGAPVEAWVDADPTSLRANDESHWPQQ